MPQPKPQVQTVESTQKTAPWEAQQEYLKKGFAGAESLYNQGPSQFYPGQTYANPDAATLAGLDATANRATAGNPLLGQAQGELSKTLNGDYLSAGNPYFQQMADRIRGQVQPGIDARYSAGNRLGSGLASRAVSMGLGDAVGALAYQNYGDERNRMTAATAAAPGLAAADYLDPQMLGQVGAAREAIAQQPITEDVARYEYNQAAPWDNLGRYMQMVQGNYGSSGTSTAQQLIPQQNPWAQILGLGLQGAGAAGQIFSDERLKENIERVGRTDDGLPIYTYDYKWGGPKQMGVMAQDVAKVKPWAVGKVGPWMTVNYGEL
jgi:phage tail protein X